MRSQVELEKGREKKSERIRSLLKFSNPENRFAQVSTSGNCLPLRLNSYPLMRAFTRSSGRWGNFRHELDLLFLISPILSILVLIKPYESYNYKTLIDLSPINHYLRTIATSCVALFLNDITSLIATDSKPLDSSYLLRK